MPKATDIALQPNVRFGYSDRCVDPGLERFQSCLQIDALGGERGEFGKRLPIGLVDHLCEIGKFCSQQSGIIERSIGGQKCTFMNSGSIHGRRSISR